jgi:imidazolonepropionase-like amidohydrolase
VTEARYRIGVANLKKAKAAGIPFMTGTDTGFAITPYGEWHARELELFVQDLGFTPAEALRAATEVNGRFMSAAGEIGTLEEGRNADFIVLDGSPLADIGLLLDKSRLRAVHIGGKRVEIENRAYDPRKVTDFSLSNWTDLYTQARVAELRGNPHRLAAE